MQAGRRVYIGTYSKANSKGIYVYDLDSTGQLRDTGQTAQAQNPSFLALHPDGQYLYAVSEVGQSSGEPDCEPGGGVSAFAIDARTGGLSLLNQQSSRGEGPCHVAVDPGGHIVTVANYGGGSIASLPIESDGCLGPASAFFQHQGSSVNPNRQCEPHAHSVAIDASGRFALACDLGLDQILTYPLDGSRSRLAPQVLAASTRPGAGPRHFAFHPSARFGYSINELDSTISAFAYEPESGELRDLQTVPALPSDFAGQSSGADIHASPSGQFLYASNRGHDSLAMFAIDGATGLLSPLGHEPTQGHTPRGFAIDPTGAFLLAANQDSDSVVVFRIDKQTGRLAPTGQVVEVPSPVCVKFQVP